MRRAYLSRVRQAQDNIKVRELGIMYKDLEVVGLGASASYQTTFGSALSPSAILDAVQSLRHPSTRNILTGFEGVVRPGEMTRTYGPNARVYR